MKRSSSVPEMAGPGPSSSVGTDFPMAPACLRSRRGISTSQISLPGDLTRPLPLPSTMDTASSSSSSFSSAWRAPLLSPIPLSRLSSPTSRPHRVEQLKKEECIDERQSEKEVMEINTLNQSYEELRVDTGDLMDMGPSYSSPSHQPSFLSPSSPLAKLGSSARSRSLTPTSPLPNRTYCRRSCSPVLRPSQLWAAGQKRKRDNSYTEMDMDTSPTYPAKRFQPSSAYRAQSPTISPTLPPSNTGTSPLSRKSSSQSESTPLSSPSSLLATGATLNPFAAVGCDSGSCEHWQSSGSASSSGGQSPLLVAAGRTARENGRNPEDLRRPFPTSQVLDMKNNLQIETAGLPEPNPEAPSPLSPKGLQFRYRPFLSSSSSLQSPIPRSASSLVATPTSSRSPRPPSSSLLPHDKCLSPFNSDLTPHSHTHHRQLHRLRTHLSTSSVGVPSVHRSPQSKAELLAAAETAKSRTTVNSPLSKLSVSTSVDEYHLLCVREEGRGDQAQQKKRRSSETSLDRDEGLMESDSSLPESCDEGLGVPAATKQT